MFHLFAYEEYYPFGGMNDYIGTFNTAEQAFQAFQESTKRDPFPERGEIVRFIDGRLVVTHYVQETASNEFVIKRAEVPSGAK